MKGMTRKSNLRERGRIAKSGQGSRIDTPPLPSRQLPMNFHSYHDSRSLRMDHLTQKTITTSRSLTYTYYRSTKSISAKPTLPLLLYSWPDSAHLWASLSSPFTNLPFPVLIPDPLSYRGTSKPTDVSSYNSKSMGNDLSKINDAEGVDKVIVAGHGWGSFPAQRFCLFRVVSIILLNIAYNPPGPTI